ncbi:MAG: helix-turn-helix domain-containing protein [Candidatus Merdivicinus sp.]|jgi:AraC family transcriptional regulator of arabinose operon
MKIHLALQKRSEAHALGLFQAQLSLCGHFRNDSNHSVERIHGIEETILIYCIRGQGYLDCKGQYWKIRAGDAILLRALEPHGYGADPTNPWDIYWIHYKGDLGELYNLAEEKKLIPIFHPGIRTGCTQHFEELLMWTDHTRVPSLLERLKIEELSKMILLELLDTGNAPDSLSGKVQAYMTEHLAEALTLDQLATHFHMSKYHFAHCFRRETGYPPMEYLSRQRVAAACSLLLETDRTIRQISQDLGYTTPYYFSEQFKKMTGYAPIIYRRVMRQQ